jgi:hypothetical protein
VKEGYEVTALDNFSAGKGEKIQHHLNNENCHLMRAQGISARPKCVPPKSGNIRHSYAEMNKAERIQGYKPRIRLEEGTRRCFKGRM